LVAHQAEEKDNKDNNNNNNDQASNNITECEYRTMCIQQQNIQQRKYTYVQ